MKSKPIIFDQNSKFYSMVEDSFNDVPEDCDHCAYREFMRICGKFVMDCPIRCDTENDKENANNIFRSILYKTLMSTNGALLYTGNMINPVEGGLKS